VPVLVLVRALVVDLTNQCLDTTIFARRAVLAQSVPILHLEK
jgi:hypothetical protein